ncbi:MAG TPA: bifunctional pyr operon transcriptional regulator/uracil phosphoribosyltransferase PyrR [Burkholderiales bacterium]|nr:bifunctional pyr operon transcriptional regulator/uracil phosphoribosyltransferase PyrR [Burkholderiales bacterium]
MSPAPLPDAESLCAALLEQLRPAVQANTVMIGVHTGGAWIAEKLHAGLCLKTPLGTLDISFYRDDFARVGLNPQVKKSTIPFDIEDAAIILVDDVLYTGRTVRAAMNELFDYGRPARIDLAVLADRGGRELPVAARFVGTQVELRDNQSLNLARDGGGRLSFSLVEKSAP